MKPLIETAFALRQPLASGTMRCAGGLCRGLAVVLVSGLMAVEPVAGSPPKHIADQLVTTAPEPVFTLFLNRLMIAESSGRNDAKNPRSTALGSFQFIKSTFLEITRRHFQAELAGLTEEEILARRTDPDLSRRAATLYCREIVLHFKAVGFDPTFAHLRLAYLLGPVDAVRIIQAPPETPVASLLSAEVITANPFMRAMSAADLLAKSKRDLDPGADVRRETASPSGFSPPAAWPTCNAKLPSCRRHVALWIARGYKAVALSQSSRVRTGHPPAQ